MTTAVRVAKLDEIPVGKSKLVRAAGKTIALFNVGGQVYALDDSCPHQGSSLAAGKLEGAQVMCRAHGLRFDVRTGCMRGVEGFGATSYPVRVVADAVVVEIS